MTRMTRMGAGFVMAENLFRGHPPGEGPCWNICLPLFALISVFSVFSGQVPFSG